MTDRELTGNEKYQLGKPMYVGPGSYDAVVTHAVEHRDSFPSQSRGPVLTVYCRDENDEIIVEPRWLTPAGVGMNHEPQFRLSDLEAMEGNDDPWFHESQIPFPRWRALALQHAPKETT